MFKQISLISATAVLLLASGYANESKGKVVIPVDRTDPTNGKLMFSSYCAPCHGADARGNGPVASALNAPPTDLTMLSKSHGGKYPDEHIVAVLQFGSAVSAHGTAGMPVWGPLLGKISNVKTQETALRIANLIRYLESIQAK